MRPHHVTRQTSSSGGDRGKHQNPGSTPRWSNSQTVNSYCRVISGPYQQCFQGILLDNLLTLPTHSNVNRHEYHPECREGKPLFWRGSLETWIAILVKQCPRKYNPVHSHHIRRYETQTPSHHRSSKGVAISPAQKKKSWLPLICSQNRTPCAPPPPNISAPEPRKVMPEPKKKVEHSPYSESDDSDSGWSSSPEHRSTKKDNSSLAEHDANCTANLSEGPFPELLDVVFRDDR